ncbi:MAG: TlpA family protein disulfide reductase [Syntrophaceae bacterium]|nr:TlpA family protein disulfide reductase [Syntrophaceae bacterium]
MLNKKFFLVLVFLFIFAFVLLSFGQYRPGFFRQDKVLAPDFSLRDINGKTFGLSSQRGNPVVIFFGTTWCAACRGELPFFRDLFDKYALHGIKFIYIDINESTERVARFAKQNSFPYLVLVDSDGSVATDYNIIGVPTLILLDKEGNIINIGHRISDLQVDKIMPEKK